MWQFNALAGGLLSFILDTCPNQVSLYWQDSAKRQIAGIKFTQRPKISIFARPTWDSCEIWHSLGARGAVQHFTRIGAWV